MTSGDPWQNKGARPDDRSTAPSPVERAARPPSEESLAAINDRLEGLSRQLDHLSTLNAARAQRRPGLERDEDVAQLMAGAMSGLNSRLDELIAARRCGEAPAEAAGAHRAGAQERSGPPVATPTNPLDQALVEIAERQRALDAEVASRSDLPRAPTQGFADLESVLRTLTRQIETLRPCGIDKAIETLRDDLAEIGLMIKEAMPRQAVEALEKEVRALSERVRNDRQAGVDGSALAGIERGLAEVRDALRALTPAENLHGFEEAVRSLSQRIDRIAVSGRDPAAVEQLESAMASLRSVVSHVASNDALTKLSEEVRALTAKVEEAGAPTFLANLERRIATIADALESRHQLPTMPQASLGIGADASAEQAGGGAGQSAAGQLERRIGQLVDKLDAADARLDQLGTVERGIAELLARLESQRDLHPSSVSGIAPAEMSTLKRDVQRTQDSLEAVHGTLGHLVDRLAMVETGIRRAGAPAPETTEPSQAGTKASAGPARTGARSLFSAGSFVLHTAPSALADPRDADRPLTGGQPVQGDLAFTSPSERRAIDPTLPPDHPLEPGTGSGRAAASPAERIAASEAALGPAKPTATSSDAAGRANFIAAARRAAQAASSEPVARIERASTEAGEADSAPNTGSWVGKHVRTLLAGASVFVLVAATVHLATTPFGSPDGARDDASTIATADAVREPGSTSSAAVEEDPAEQPQRTMALASRADDAAFGVPAAGLLVPPEPARPAALSAHATGGDTGEPLMTGSVRAPLPEAAPARPAGPAMMPAAVPPQRAVLDRLPGGIAGTLREAAAKGDPAAEYEVALRLAEGRGVAQDMKAAAEWFERAAGRGVVPAQFRLGGLYEKGMGVKKDLERARRLYLSAAQAGNAKAMHNLAVLYAEGVEGKPDYQTSARWFRKAAEHGMSDSQYNLGILYARGIGVEVNMAEAYKWFALAARDGDAEAARKRDDVAGRLDHTSLLAARSAVQVWAAEPQPEAAIGVKSPAGGWDTPRPTPKRRVGPKTEASTARSAQ